MSFLHWNTRVEEVLSTESYIVLQYNLSKEFWKGPNEWSGLFGLGRSTGKRENPNFCHI